MGGDGGSQIATEGAVWFGDCYCFRLSTGLPEGSSRHRGEASGKRENPKSIDRHFMTLQAVMAKASKCCAPTFAG